MRFDCIVAGSQLRYDGVWQRPHHLLTRLAERVPVLFVEEPFIGARDSNEITVHGGLSVLRPVRATAGDARIDASALAAARAWAGARRPLVWLYTPMMNELADAFAQAPVVYDCMDELAAFAFAPPEMQQREAALMERAARIFAGGRSLFAKRRALGEKVFLYPSAVEYEHFAQAPGLPPHELLVHLRPPICGYIGAIDERIDFEAIGALAERDVQVVLVGPVLKIDSALLPRRANVHFTGQMEYAALPRLLAGFDVALMPFAMNDATVFISPTKTLEYLAAGKPVVSTPIEDVIASYGDVVSIAAGSQAFADACLAAAARPDAARRLEGSERARAWSWEQLVSRMWRDLERE